MKDYIKLFLGLIGIAELIFIFFWTIGLFFYVFTGIEGTFLIQKNIYFIWLAPLALFLKDKKVLDLIIRWGDKIL